MKTLQNEHGNSILLTTFLLLAMMTISLVIYTISLVYAKYQAAQVELERAGSVSVDRNMENNNVRDLELNIPVTVTQMTLEANLMNTGWEEESAGKWVRRSGGQELYRVSNLNAVVNAGWMDTTGVWSMPLPCLSDTLPAIQIPIAVKSKVFYIDP